MVVGALAAAGAYIAVLGALGLAADDRIVADQLRARLRVRRAVA